MRRTWGARGILTLTSRFDCMVRKVEFILFSRAMCTYYKVQAEAYLALCGSTDDLIRRTASWLLDTSLDDKVAEELGIVDAGHLAELKAMRPYSMTWIEAAVLLADVEPATTLEEVDRVLPEVMAHHHRLANKMSSHMLLTWENFPKAEHLLMELCGLEPHTAQLGACRLRDYLKDLRPDAMTAFERSLTDDLRLMHQLELFSHCIPPKLLHHHDRCHDLFEYAADRCLACQDASTHHAPISRGSDAVRTLVRRRRMCNDDAFTVALTM